MSSRTVRCLIAFTLVAFSSLGQPGGGPPDPPGEPVPIPGVEILVAVGGLLGAKFLGAKRLKK